MAMSEMAKYTVHVKLSNYMYMIQLKFVLVSMCVDGISQLGLGVLESILITLCASQVN